jgi:hypothetical protein
VWVHQVLVARHPCLEKSCDSTDPGNPSSSLVASRLVLMRPSSDVVFGQRVADDFLNVLDSLKDIQVRDG